MANVPLTFGSGGGSGSDDCTGAKAQARAGYTFIANDTDDEPEEGLIQDYSGSSSFTPSTESQSIPSGGKYCASNITVNAIPSQANGGDVRLTASSPSSTFAASQWSLTRHYVYVDVFSW